MTPDEFKAEMARKVAQYKEEVPKELGEEARQYFFESFDAQGFGGDAWPERQGSYDWPILVKSGQLKADVGAAAIEARWEETTITVSNDYAAYHNFGTSKLPIREFVGTNEQLEAKLVAVFEAKFREIFE